MSMKVFKQEYHRPCCKSNLASAEHQSITYLLHLSALLWIIVKKMQHCGHNKQILNARPVSLQ